MKTTNQLIEEATSGLKKQLIQIVQTDNNPFKKAEAIEKILIPIFNLIANKSAEEKCNSIFAEVKMWEIAKGSHLFHQLAAKQLLDLIKTLTLPKEPNAK